jgi:dihydroxyacetone kinase-like predicted kinase
MKIKVDNMRMQHDAVLEKADTPAKKLEKIPYGVIAVAAGEGVHALFKSMGVTTIINGGQTMNPSTEDILKAIESTNAEKTIILPNNKNIFMAADQAAEVSDADVVVVASKTISQGLTAMLAFNESEDLETNKANMTAELENVVSGQITNAVRDTVIDGLAITKDDFMGIVDGKILTADKDRKAATIATLKKMITDDSEIVTIIFGEDSDENESKEIAAVIEAEYDFLEVEVQEGNQPVYSYLLSVE